MPGGFHRHCCCEPPGLCGACPQVGESITAVVSGIEMCAGRQLLSGSINGVHTLEWWPDAIGMCIWRAGPIARIIWVPYWESDVYIYLCVRPDTIQGYPPATEVSVDPYIFQYLAFDEIRCEGEYQNRYLICGEGTAPHCVGGTITLSR